MTTSRTLQKVMMVGFAVALVVLLGVPGFAQTRTKYDVGFDKTTTLKASGTLDDALTPPLTYSWSQTGGPEVTISAPTAATPKITTGPLSDFVPLHEQLGLVGITTEEISDSTYTFRVIISDASMSKTGTVVVTAGSPTSGQANIPIGVNQYFTAPEAPSYSWTLKSAPEGSGVSLRGANTRTPYLRPDVQGNYVINEGNSDTDINVYAANYVGSWACGFCHGADQVITGFGLADLVTPWSMTGHASMAQRGLDGIASSHYGESCLKCHTVGYNKRGSANNGGWDDVAKALGWTFPTSLVPGNWDALPQELKDKGNIQCENCHGPGSYHPGVDTSNILSVSACSWCHQDGNHHLRPEQWEHSPHSEHYAELSEEEGTSSSCARCHAPMGFIDQAKGLTSVRTGTGPLVCQACHDPHNVKGYPHQVRVYDTVTVGDLSLAGTVTFTGQGTSATCMYCHNGRRLPMQVYTSGSDAGKMRYQTGVSHESTAAEVLNGIGGIDYGIAMGSSVHKFLAKCTDCHMYENPGEEDPGHNRVGDHTFSMEAHDGDTEIQHVAACNQCHDYTKPVDDFDYVSLSAGDYDGDGEIEGVQSETEELLEIVLDLILESGVDQVIEDDEWGYPWFENYAANPALSDAQHKATWNWWLVYRDLSKGVHNTQFTIRLLQTTYTQLSLAIGGDSFSEDYPLAYLR